MIKPIAAIRNNATYTIVIASGLGTLRFSRISTTGRTPNAMNAAIKKIAIVRGMCSPIHHRMRPAATATATTVSMRRHAGVRTRGFCTAAAAP